MVVLSKPQQGECKRFLWIIKQSSFIQKQFSFFAFPKFTKNISLSKNVIFFVERFFSNLDVYIYFIRFLDLLKQDLVNSLL